MSFPAGKVLILIAYWALVYLTTKTEMRVLPQIMAISSGIVLTLALTGPTALFLIVALAGAIYQLGLVQSNMGGVLARLAEPTPLTLAVGTSLMTALTWAPLR